MQLSAVQIDAMNGKSCCFPELRDLALNGGPRDIPELPGVILE